MCENKAFFDTVTKCDGVLVTFGDGSTSKVVGKGNVRSQGIRYTTCKDVLQVEGLKANLISIS